MYLHIRYLRYLHMRYVFTYTFAYVNMVYLVLDVEEHRAIMYDVWPPDDGIK